MIARIGAIVYIAAIVVITVIFTIRDANDILVREVVIEAGTEIKIEDFFEKCPEERDYFFR